MMDLSPSDKNIADCPECGVEIRLKKAPFRGQMINCRRCGTRLKVSRKQPLEFVWADQAWEDEVEPRYARSSFDDLVRGAKTERRRH